MDFLGDDVGNTVTSALSFMRSENISYPSSPVDLSQLPAAHRKNLHL
ncbi:MAG: hypothetical protein ACRDOI_30830 [Trebonia sp.]